MTTVLFDLDGTLLPMDQDAFIKAYFQCLAAKLAPYGYEPAKLIDSVWAGTAAMVENDGSRTNEEVFWACFAATFGERALQDKPLFDAFYREDFQKAAAACGFNPQARDTIDDLKHRGVRIALATNPIFPAVATESRMRWAGLDPAAFEFYTTYENSRSCKPNPAYYRELTERLGCRAEDCLMVGNDVGEDMVAAETGMRVFLLTDCLINKTGRDIGAFPHGGFDELRCYLDRDLPVNP